MGSKLLYSLPALVLALLALIIAVVGLSQNSKPENPDAMRAKQSAAQDSQRFHYWVVTKSLKIGDKLSPDQLAVVASPTEIPGAVSADVKVAGREVERFSRPGELLTNNFFNAGGSLPSALPPGQRAMAIQINDISGVGGLLRPGDTVDVVTAFRQSENKKGAAALVMMHNITVLAVHGQLSRDSDKKTSSEHRNDTVVLSVPKGKVPELLLASSQGEIRLAVVARAPAADSFQEDNPVAVRQRDTAALAGSSTSGKSSSAAVVANDVKAGQSGDGEKAGDANSNKPFYFNDFFPAEQKPAPAVHHRPRGYRVQVFEGAETRSTYVR